MFFIARQWKRSINSNLIPRGLTEGNWCVHGKFSHQLSLNIPLTQLTYGLLLQKSVLNKKRNLCSFYIWLSWQNFFYFPCIQKYCNDAQLNANCEISEFGLKERKKDKKLRKIYNNCDPPNENTSYRSWQFGWNRVSNGFPKGSKLLKTEFPKGF